MTKPFTIERIIVRYTYSQGDCMALLNSVSAILATGVLVVMIRLVFRKAHSSSRQWPYQRQFLVLLVVLAGLFISIALLPLEHEVKNQILSLLGILLSAVIALSSTTLVSNAMAGLMLRITHEFRGGDFIEVDTLVGRVTDLGIFHTEVQLVSRDVVSLPNLLLSQKAVKVTRRDGTFINLALSIGYMVSHQEVEKALLEAANRCKLTDSFVFVEAFLDHAIRYRLYGMLSESGERLSKTSELHKSVLDVFCEEGIEIASPALMDRREYDTAVQYFPKIGKKNQTRKEATIVEELVFDKADEAQSLEELKEVQTRLSKSLEKLDAKQKKVVEEKIARIGEEIVKREEKRKES